jgi:lipopolysaccharide/colanic/teichoic acid biosynthesis glycosyltransferase
MQTAEPTLRSAPLVAPAPAPAPALPAIDRGDLLPLIADLQEWKGWSLPRRSAKRALDIGVSSLMLLALLPVLLILAVAIRICSPGPVLYRQRRCGRDNQSFDVLKLRSMRQDADKLLDSLREHNESDGLLFKMSHDPRITRVGAFIRRYSLDELPQLVNVLKGDMSLVGPRPLPVPPEAFGPVDGRRHAVRPGLTCHWQVSGRSNISYGQMIQMDLDYIHSSSIWTDLRLLVRTVPVVVTGTGAY